ncbi:aspartyl/asparaginyl beta-hydroxylase domain-containing protein [Streptomyces sp. NPDC059467]|uniref:aspartyl/asparaginyl beta-hydroxylase domain-containing protein n=1 Tax=Streptomyces sp. NPDC059467 TaxID=3346844 RepID=UPI0036C7823E
MTDTTAGKAPGAERTRRLATVPLDTERLAADLEVMDRLPYASSYSDFAFAPLRNTMLWNATGVLGEALLGDYPGGARPTEHGRLLPYVNELITGLFRTEHLKFARLLVLPPGCVMVPHRDYLELDQDMIRIHVPLRTSERCFSSQGDTVFHMRAGEMWFLDATRTHTAASFWDIDRIHLTCDFIAGSIDEVLTAPAAHRPGVPAGNIAPRRPLRPAERDALLGLADLIDLDNYRDVMAVLTKRHFEALIQADEVFGWMKDIAAASGRPEVLDRVARDEEYYLVRR